jgi:amidophosphoribosyltransferase
MAEIKEACGIFGIYLPEEKDTAIHAFNGLFFLQHRGQESAGIYVATRKGIKGKKNLGLLSEIFNEDDLAEYKGHIAIGHVRYSTTGSNDLQNAQPIIVGNHIAAIAHNGNLTNTEKLYLFLKEKGISLKKSSTDSHVIAGLLKYNLAQYSDFDKAVVSTFKKLKGAFSLVIMTNKKLYAIRDSNGFRPLMLGYLADERRSSRGYFVASESCVTQIKDYRFIREIKPGEMITIDHKGYSSKLVLPCKREAFCIFEFIYFARPDTYFFGMNVGWVRVELGKQLWLEHPVKADIVVPVPDSGLWAAQGLSEASGIPLRLGLVRNHYSPRSFIRPKHATRENDVYLKLAPLHEIVRGKKILLVDDSIVRGNTSGKIVTMLYKAGASEVHMRVISPPIVHPCHFGIDTSKRKELIASDKTIDGICRYIGADSLGYLSIEGMVKATRIPDKFCCACFNGIYPIKVPKERDKYLLEKNNIFSF